MLKSTSQSLTAMKASLRSRDERNAASPNVLPATFQETIFRLHPVMINTMDDEGRAESIREAFNDAARDGYPVSLSSRSEPPEDVVPVSLASAMGVGGIYYRIYDSLTQHEFVASRLKGILRIPRVVNIELVDANGNGLSAAPPDLSTCFLRFVVRGNPRGDVYRVEIFPDPTVAIQEIDQVVAGKHVTVVQNFRLPLRGTARTEFQLSIFRVDREMAKRDVNGEAPLESRETFRVLP